MSDPSSAPPSPMRGRWFDELPVGFTIRHALTRTVSEFDNTLFSTLSMNPQPLHLDAEFAAGTEFGQRLFNSLFTLAIVVGISVPDLTLGTTVANLGFSSVTFPAPVFHGDTLSATSEVIAARPSSSRPGQGVVTFVHRGFNQRGELVVAAERLALMLGAPAS